mmetsp:Transcript_7798/g.14870  ORF Transcript_7798/g.14870 Transcript_7798/m.14870 type:complete len:298 (-) Transcript_7798:1283-2176(-)
MQQLVWLVFGIQFHLQLVVFIADDPVCTKYGVQVFVQQLRLCLDLFDHLVHGDLVDVLYKQLTALFHVKLHQQQHLFADSFEQVELFHQVEHILPAQLKVLLHCFAVLLAFDVQNTQGFSQKLGLRVPALLFQSQRRDGWAGLVLGGKVAKSGRPFVVHALRGKLLKPVFNRLHNRFYAVNSTGPHFESTDQALGVLQAEVVQHQLVHKRFQLRRAGWYVRRQHLDLPVLGEESHLLLPQVCISSQQTRAVLRGFGVLASLKQVVQELCRDDVYFVLFETVFVHFSQVQCLFVLAAH